MIKGKPFYILQEGLAPLTPASPGGLLCIAIVYYTTHIHNTKETQKETPSPFLFFFCRETGETIENATKGAYSMARRRNKALTIRGTVEEIAELKTRAKAAKLSQRDFILQACFKAKVCSLHDIDALTKQVRAIGNNINQIAHKVNYYDNVQVEDIEEAQEGLGEIWQLLRQLQAGQD